MGKRIREFNTSGPCDPKEHYTLVREPLLKIGKDKVRKGRYFTIWAPRQTGKTTYFQLLHGRLRRRKGYLPIWMTFEGWRGATAGEFFELFREAIVEKTRTHELPPWRPLTRETQLKRFFDRREEGVRIVLFVDEVEGCPEDLVEPLMHTFRQLYHERAEHSLHSLVLVGVSNLSGLLMSHSSPFNIAEELSIPYFSEKEVAELIGQYVEETGHSFEGEVIEKIHADTIGQPGLVCGIAEDLVERFCPDRSTPVTMDHYRRVIDYYLRRKIDKNVSNIVAKAKAHRELMIQVLFEEEKEFNLYDDRIKELAVNGVVQDRDGAVDVRVPIYKKALISAFAPLRNGEIQHYTGVKEDLDRFVTETGALDVEAILANYRAYLKRRGWRAFDVANLRESACHYNFDAYLSFFVEAIGGDCYLEIPSGRGRIDLMVRFRGRRYVFEVKLFRDASTHRRGKAQLAAYLESEGLDEGYYIVFSRVHTEEDVLQETAEVEGRRIHTWIFPVELEVPSG